MSTDFQEVSQRLHRLIEKRRRFTPTLRVIEVSLNASEVLAIINDIERRNMDDA